MCEHGSTPLFSPLSFLLSYLRAQAGQVEVVLDVVIIHRAKVLVAAEGGEPGDPGGGLTVKVWEMGNDDGRGLRLSVCVLPAPLPPLWRRAWGGKARCAACAGGLSHAPGLLMGVVARAGASPLFGRGEPSPLRRRRRQLACICSTQRAPPPPKGPRRTSLLPLSSPAGCVRRICPCLCGGGVAAVGCQPRAGRAGCHVEVERGVARVSPSLARHAPRNEGSAGTRFGREAERVPVRAVCVYVCVCWEGELSAACVQTRGLPGKPAMRADLRVDFFRPVWVLTLSLSLARTSAPHKTKG